MSDLIERQDAIDALKKIMFTHLFENGEYIGEDTREVSIMNAEKALDVIENLSSAEPEQKWISMAERLPKDGERVLITHRGGVSFGWYNGSYWERGAPTNHRPLETVIAWMSLPESYKGD